MQTEIKFKLNGQEVSFVGSPLARLIDVIRENFNLLGSKEG